VAIGIAALLAADSFPVVLAMIAVLAAGAALVIPNLSALVATGARAGTGLALGWKSSASSLGQFLGPLVGGSLIGWQPNLPFQMAAMLLLGVAAVVAVAYRRRPVARPRPTVATPFDSRLRRT
jgi:MFS family permease